MFQKIIKSCALQVIIIVAIYVIQSLVFSYSNVQQSNFKYSLLQLYLFFGIFTLIINVVLHIIKQKNIDLVGNVFLGLTLFKMMFCFAIGNTILNLVNDQDKIQKHNFLMLFFIFLFLETIVTIKLLNTKES